MSETNYLLRAATAVHEAGHVAIAARRGIRATGARVNVDQSGLARLVGALPTQAAEVYLAGGLAEQHLGHLIGARWTECVRDSDLHEATRLLARWTAVEIDALVAGLQREIAGDAWPHIAAVGFVLWQRMTIDADQVHAIMIGPGDTGDFERHVRGLLS